MSCEAEKDGMQCILSGNHTHHFARRFEGRVAVEACWENDQWVKPQPKEKGTRKEQRAKATADMKPLLDRIRDNPAAEGVTFHGEPRETEAKAALRALPGSGTQRRQVLDHIVAQHRRGDLGATDEQVAHTLGLPLNSVRPRRNELMEGGWVEDSGEVRLTVTLNEAIVWKPTSKALSGELRTLTLS